MKRLCIAFAACLLLAACNDPYGASAKAGADVATAIAQGFSIVGTLIRQGQINQAEATNVANYLEYANVADEAFLDCVSAAHTNASKGAAFTSCATTLNAALNDPSHLALIHVANAGASNQIAAYVGGIVTGVTALEAALGGK